MQTRVVVKMSKLKSPKSTKSKKTADIAHLDSAYWRKISDLYSSHNSLKSHLMHSLGSSGSISPKRIFDDSLFLLSLSNAIAEVLKHPSANAHDRSQVIDSYNMLVDAAKALSEDLYNIDLQHNAADASSAFTSNLSKLESLMNESSVHAIANGGKMPAEQLTLCSKRLEEIQGTFNSIRRKLYSQPSSHELSAGVLSNFIKIRKNVESICDMIEKMPENQEIAPQMSPVVASHGNENSFEKFKVSLVKSMIQLVSGKVLIDRKHVTIKSAHNGMRKSFLLTSDAKHAILDLFESTFVKDSISEIVGGSDGVVVAAFDVSYDGAEPKAIHMTIGSRKHEGNSITFAPVSMYLPSGQVEAIGSLDFEDENS